MKEILKSLASETVSKAAGKLAISCAVYALIRLKKGNTKSKK